jgi:hypothetical protein
MEVGYVVCAALSEAVLLYGIAFRFLGAPRSLAVPFYIAGFLLMLLSAPRKFPVASMQKPS